MKHRRSLLHHPATIAFAYVVFSVCWIFLTDLAIERAALSSHATAAISIFKGSIFVLGSALLIFRLLRKAISDSEKVRVLLESAPDAMVIVDRTGTITLVNAQAERLFGYSRAELIGEPVEFLIPHRFREQHPAHRQAAFSEERARAMGTGLPLYGLRKDGTEFPADISLSPIRTEDGFIICSDIRDVSERKLAEQQIRKLNTQLELALRRSEKLAVTGGLMATMAHEINNPLESLNNLLHVLRTDSRITDGSRELLDAAEKQVALVTTISRQTLAPHRETKSPVKTKLSELLNEIIVLFDRKLQSSGIKVFREYQSEGEVVIYPADFRQVFTNLIANAIDAMAAGGELHLGIEQSVTGEVVVRVKDSGCGIAPDRLGAIFEPFYTTKGERGTGVGLWVTKGIVEKVGGRIDVESSVSGKTGTTFSVFFPATAAVLS